MLISCLSFLRIWAALGSTLVSSRQAVKCVEGDRSHELAGWGAFRVVPQAPESTVIICARRKPEEGGFPGLP